MTPAIKAFFPLPLFRSWILVLPSSSSKKPTTSPSSKSSHTPGSLSLKWYPISAFLSPGLDTTNERCSILARLASKCSITRSRWNSANPKKKKVTSYEDYLELKLVPARLQNTRPLISIWIGCILIKVSFLKRRISGRVFCNRSLVPVKEIW